MKNMPDNCLWHDRKRNVFGLPWSFTRYILTEQKLTIDKGLLTRVEEEIWLYRITDISMKSNLIERLFDVGTIHCCSLDKTTPEFDLVRVKGARNVKEMLSNMVETARRERRVDTLEFTTSNPHDD